MMIIKIFVAMIGVFMFFHLLIGFDRMTSKKSKAPWWVVAPLFLSFVFNTAMVAYCLADRFPEVLVSAWLAYLSVSIYMIALYFDRVEISKIYKNRHETD